MRNASRLGLCVWCDVDDATLWSLPLDGGICNDCNDMLPALIPPPFQRAMVRDASTKRRVWRRVQHDMGRAE